LLPHAVTRRTMNNRFPILSLLALAPLAVSAVPSGPNFVIIVPDDQRWDATGFMQERMAGLGRIARFPWYAGMTPGMDRLSREGVHFDNAFVTHSICSPSRASMLTGRYAHQVGVVDNQSYFPVESVTYATLMRDAGWATGYFGKWHMHDQPDQPGQLLRQLLPRQRQPGMGERLGRRRVDRLPARFHRYKGIGRAAFPGFPRVQDPA